MFEDRLFFSSSMDFAMSMVSQTMVVRENFLRMIQDEIVAKRSILGDDFDNINY